MYKGEKGASNLEKKKKLSDEWRAQAPTLEKKGRLLKNVSLRVLSAMRADFSISDFSISFGRALFF